MIGGGVYRPTAAFGIRREKKFLPARGRGHLMDATVAAERFRLSKTEIDMPEWLSSASTMPLFGACA
jgi:hypothetical protein